MSSFVVSDDHIDYLVTAALVHVPDHPAVVGSEPTELGRLFLRENVATVADRYLDCDEEDLDDDEREELESYTRRVAEYVFRTVGEVDAAQAVLVARCWQYQRGRESASDLPETWVLADALVDAALATLPDSAFEDPAGPRDSGNLAGRDSLAWGWRR